ncbi:dihydroxyacetone kinase [Venturia nashicola]|uniref:Dihydroxyacetone kinase n=1 Tax=Venturia nashicola TaxID=86259 RepID=A0A4Z1NTU2_9PEZI|nr:dihydroxyacetone kinase [Venturia nashicola]
MSSKHFHHHSNDLILSALHSLTHTNPSLSLSTPHKIIYQSQPQQEKVSLLSGGGSGHEPSFSSFTGHGLLTASISGSIFASPSATQISTAIQQFVPSGKGVLVVVMNYTGDVLNFGISVEKARGRGIAIEMVVVGDDVGVGRAASGKVGRRGIAGTCLVLKITGALAETGASLLETQKVAEAVAQNLVSIGASLAHVHVPGREGGVADLGEGVVEVGMGIHNEAGSERVQIALPELVKKMLVQLLDPADTDRAFLSPPHKKGDEFVLLVNNLGGVSVLEMGGIANQVIEELETTWEIVPKRVLVGTFMTSLNGMGFSISLLRLADTGLGAGKSMLELLDAPTEATGWAAAVKTETWNLKREVIKQEEVKEVDEEIPGNLKFDYALAKSALTTALERAIAAEPDITNYDTIVGDGDCGIGLKRGAEAILKMLERAKKTDDVLIFLQRIIQGVESTMDGTSGALYAIFLNALASGVRSQSPTSSSPAAEVREQMQVGIWARALESSMITLSKYTPAQPGDRTLMDALYPFVGTLSRTGNVQKAAEAADEGAKKTKAMKASLGRTVYVGGEGWQNVPDPGAYGLAQFLLGLSEGLKQSSAN